MRWNRVLWQFFEGWVRRRELISLGIGPTSCEEPRPERTGYGSRSQMVPREPHPLNASGPFYSENGLCIISLAPEAAAPDLMDCYEDPSGTARQSHCFFRRQPKTSEELDQAIAAMEVSCIANIRYSGNDSTILKRLCEMGYRHLCDALDSDGLN